MKWFVKIPVGHWMAGVNAFSTKVKAMTFLYRWNEVAVNSGNAKLTFEREGNSFVGRA